MNAVSFLKEEEFNLLLLQDNELYLLDCDLLALYFVKNNNTTQHYRGSIRLTSESIIFQPVCSSQKTSIDLLKFPFEGIRQCSLGEFKNKSCERFCLTLGIVELIRIPVIIVADTLRAVTSHIVEKVPSSSEWNIQLLPVTKTDTMNNLSLDDIVSSPEEALHHILELTHNNSMYFQNSSSDSFLKLTYDLVFLFLYDKSIKSQRICKKTNIMHYSSLITLISKTLPPSSIFSLSHLKSTHERLVHPVVQVEIQFPLHRAKCLLALTDAALYYKVHPSRKTSQFERLPWSALQHVIYRIVDLRHTGLLLLFCWNIELNEASWAELSFNFISERERYAVVQAIKSLRFHAFLICEDSQYVQHFTNLWVEGLFDSYHYLQLCNHLSNRTEADFSQYPVMPWSLIDFSSPTVNLTQPDAFRDLSRPIGALNKQRLICLQERMQDVTETSSPLTFLYGNHYSTPGYIVYWLSREIPESLLRLQGGRLETWPRLFHSLITTWSYLQDGRDGSLMELIPHFYCPSRTNFLENHLGINIPYSQDSKADKKNLVNPTLGVLSDVELPKWSNNNAFVALKILREALESPIVSNSLHEWIDLTFGFKQQGKEAERAMNVYHPITYLTSIMAQSGGEADKALKSMTAQLDLSYEALIAQVQEFGQAPSQIFKEPHPKRCVKNIPRDLDLTNIQSLLNYPRSSYPWFVHVMQHPDLQYSSPALTCSTKIISSFCPEKNVSKHHFFHDTDDESLLRFKKSHVLSLFEKEKNHDLNVLCAHESVHDPRVLLFGCQDGLLRKVNLNHPEGPHPAIPSSSVSITAVLSIQKDIAVIGDSRGDLRLIKTSCSPYSNMMTASDSPHLDRIITLVTSSTQKTTHIPICSNYILGVWDIIPSGEPRLLSCLDQEAACISMEDSVILSGGYNGEVRLWDLRCFNTGPVWGAEAWDSRGTAKLHLSNCYLVSETLESFSFVGYVNKKGHNSNVINPSQSITGSNSWEVLLCDMRMLAPSNYPLMSDIKHSLTARHVWGPHTLLYNVNCDGQQWAIGTGVTKFNHPPIEESDFATSYLQHSKNASHETLCYFATAVDLSYGFHSRQVCRWPLLLTEPPPFIAPPSIWNINQRKQNSALPQLWLADENGSVELIY